jgi:hypothetical protein
MKKNTRWVIMKSSRANAEAPSPYRGPSCSKAGVPEGLVYTSCAQAAEDAHKLTNCNPVGFVIRPTTQEYQDSLSTVRPQVKKYKPDNRQPCTCCGQLTGKTARICSNCVHGE